MQQDNPDQDEPTNGAWLSWRLAVEHVERHRGVSWGEAAKAVDNACASSKLTCRGHLGGGGPDVWDVDFWHWLTPPYKPKSPPKKRARIKDHLAKKFHNQRVPDVYVRKDLLNELRGCGDPLLKSLDDETLRVAIEEYNSGPVLR